MAEIKIAGRPVKIGDRLYHIGWDSFGTVEGYDPTGSAIMKLVNRTGQQRTVMMQNGGRVNGVKLIYWHDRVHLDLPITNIATLQSVVDTVSAEIMAVIKKAGLVDLVEEEEDGQSE